MTGVTEELAGQPPVVRYTGVFDYDKLYATLTGWFDKNGFDLHEKKYVHKGKELEFEWFGDKKITPYYKYEVTVEMFVWDMKKVEVVEDGKKKMMNQGRIQLVIKGAYILDYKGQWEGTGIVKWMREVYHKYLIKTYIIFEVYTPLYKLVYGFYDEVRDVLGMLHT